MRKQRKQGIRTSRGSMLAAVERTVGILLAVLVIGATAPNRAFPASTVPQAETSRQEGVPQDRLYQEGREALNRGRYMEAAEILARAVQEYPTSERTGDALYWRAYALYRLEAYERALAAVRRVVEEYPTAAGRGDAQALRVRIEGALARRGDADAAARVAERARRAAVSIEAEAIQRQAERAGRQAELVGRQAEVVQRQAETGLRQAEVALMARRAGGRAQEGCEESEVQAAAINALLMMDSERALPVLEKVLARRDECSESLRTQTTWLLAQQGGERAQELLLQVVREDPSLEVRGQAVFWLSRVEGERAVEILEEVLTDATDPELQNNALFALSQHPNERAFGILRAYALDESKAGSNRAQAIFWLGQHDEFGDVQVLADVYRSLSSEELKMQVLYALAQNADEEGAVDWLVERALDQSEPLEVRKQALFWAGQAGVEIERLDGLYESLADPEMKLQLVFVYSQSDDEEAVERLIEIGRSEPDPKIRKQAIFWLGQSSDPRAADFLLELLETP